MHAYKYVHVAVQNKFVYVIKHCNTAASYKFIINKMLTTTNNYIYDYNLR